MVWNQVRNRRKERRAKEGTFGSHRGASGCPTELERHPDFEFPREAAAVPLRQAPRHRHRAFESFYAERSDFPRCKPRTHRGGAAFATTAFNLRDGQSRSAKTDRPVR